MQSVDSHVAQAGFGAANLHVFAFALVALEGDTGQPAHGIGNVGVRQAGDDFRRQHLQDIVGGTLAVERLHLAVFALRMHRDFFALGFDLEHGVQVCRLPGSNVYIGRKGCKSYV